MLSCSIIIATYNWPAALEKCLKSLLKQSVLPNEILVADDGSGEETEFVIRQFAQISSIPVKHIWQKNEGFRLAKIRNQAISAATHPYIIQVDGDLILHPDFIADHLRFCKPGTFISGTKSLLNEDFTQEILNSDEQPVFSMGDGRISKKYNCYRNILLSNILYQFQKGKKNAKYVVGCNMAFWKNDLEKVNGYNELFEGWGKEDNDLAVRLCNAGVDLRMIKFNAIVYHLFHKPNSQSNLPGNEKLLNESMNNHLTRASKGMNG